MMMAQDTYTIATNAGDRTFLFWLHERLIRVYGESPDADFVKTVQNFAREFTVRADLIGRLNAIGLHPDAPEVIRQYARGDLDPRKPIHIDGSGWAEAAFQ